MEGAVQFLDGFQNGNYEEVFKYFETFDRHIEDSDFTNSEGIVHQYKVGLCKALKAYVLCACDYSIDSALQSDSTEYVIELLRRLKERCDQVSDLSPLGRMTRILNMKFDEKHLEDQLATWESDISL